MTCGNETPETIFLPNDGWTTGPAAPRGTTLGRYLHRLGDMLTARCVALASLRYGSSGHSNRVSHSETAYVSMIDSGFASPPRMLPVCVVLYTPRPDYIHSWYVTIRAFLDTRRTQRHAGAKVTVNIELESTRTVSHATLWGWCTFIPDTSCNILYKRGTCA